MPAMVVGCGCWGLVAEADAGASGAAFPRWSVERSANDQKDQHDQHGGTIDDQNGAHGAPVGLGVR